jgi:hypothetical protein
MFEDKIVHFQIIARVMADVRMATTGHVKGSNSRPTWEVPGSNKNVWDLSDLSTLYFKSYITHSSLHLFFPNQQEVN